MRKLLLCVVALSFTMGASAQRVSKKVNSSLKMEMVKAQAPVNQVGSATVVSSSIPEFGQVKKNISKLTEAGVPEVSVRRPGGVYWGGFQAGAAAYSYYNPTLVLPAYTPLTFGVSKDEDIATGAEYWLGVQYYDEEAGALDWINNEAGEDVTTDFLPSAGSYLSPMASVTYNGAEVTSLLVNDDVDSQTGETYEGMLFVGNGVLGASNGVNRASMAGNYDAHWDGGASYSTGYFVTNSSLPYMDEEFASAGASNFRMSGIIETYDAPAAPFYVTAASLHAVVTSATCGNVNMALVKLNYTEDGKMSFGDVLATGVCAGPTDTYSTWNAFAFTELKDKEGNAIEGVVMEAGQAFALLFFLDETDKTTTLAPLYTLHTEYMADEAHSFGEYTCTLDGKETSVVLDCNYKWNLRTGGSAYNTSWMCGLVIENPYLYIYNPAIDATYEGVTAERIMAESYYSVGKEWTTVTLADGSALPDWITVEMLNGQDEEGEFNGVVAFDVTVAPNSGAARQATVKIQTAPSAYATFEVNQTANPSGIAEVAADVTKAKNVKFNMAGQKVNGNFRGLVIENGKKYMNK